MALSKGFQITSQSTAAAFFVLALQSGQLKVRCRFNEDDDGSTKRTALGAVPSMCTHMIMTTYVMTIYVV